MNALEIVTLIITAIGVVACFIGPLRIDRAFSSVGRTGSMWFEHPGDRSLDELASEDERDAPIPRRPLRARPR